MASANIHDYIAPGRRAHLVGIGGVSMSPLAEVLHKAGMVITGSDMRNSATVEHLRALGIPVAIGHRGENVQGAELDPHRRRPRRKSRNRRRPCHGHPRL